MRFHPGVGELGRATNVPGVIPSGIKGGDPPVLNEPVSRKKNGSGGHLHVPIVNVRGWPRQANSVLNVQIGLYRKKCV